MRKQTKDGLYVSIALPGPNNTFLAVNHFTKAKVPWRFPGGKIKDHELPIDAAVRELEEEVGVRAITLQLVGQWTTLIDGGRWTGLHYYCAAYDGTPRIKEPAKQSELAYMGVGELRVHKSYPGWIVAARVLREQFEGPTINVGRDVLSLRAMQQRAWQNSEDKGFHGLDQLDIPTKLMLIVTEVSEAMEEYRAGHAPTETYYDAKNKPEGMPAELADVVIRIGDLCGILGIDIEAAVKEKMAYNAGRPYMHGGKKC